MEDHVATDDLAYTLSFNGKGNEYFGIVVVNWLLLIVTLGLYYPWAKVKKLNFLYGATALNGDYFSFHGTGKEVFKGFVKAILVFGIIYSLFFLFTYLEQPFVGVFIMYAGLLSLTPIALHGSFRYRMSRTSWRGIRFGYRGDRKELALHFFKWVFLSFITFGFYIPWMIINLRNYLISNIRLGNAAFTYKATGGAYFMLNLKGYFLSFFTLGIYFFWWVKNQFAFYVDHLTLHLGDQQITLKSKATAGDFFKLLFVNMCILIFTLGLGYAWVVTRSMHLLASKIELSGDIDLENIVQTEESYTDATGEDIGDFLDFDII